MLKPPTSPETSCLLALYLGTVRNVRGTASDTVYNVILLFAAPVLSLRMEGIVYTHHAVQLTRMPAGLLRQVPDPRTPFGRSFYNSLVRTGVDVLKSGALG